ncbi:MAG: hypothetical protein K2L95_01820 [Alphaproteobacteria bacterium]|nr:hypothetical protein [Alphaproteobacteria bacterium]
MSAVVGACAVRAIVPLRETTVRIFVGRDVTERAGADWAAGVRVEFMRTALVRDGRGTAYVGPTHKTTAIRNTIYGICNLVVYKK